MSSDPWTGARLGANSDAPLGGSFLAEAVTELAPSTRPSFASQSARDTAFTNWKSNGNTPVEGMGCYTRADGRFWRLAADGVTWLYAGGNPPPIVTASAGAGWNNVGGNMPGAYMDSSGLVHLVGAVSPATTYNPTDLGTHTAATLPTGYRPARTVFFTIPQPTFALVIGMIDTAGVVNIVGGTTSSIAAGTAHYLEACPPFHPGFTGTLPLA